MVYIEMTGYRPGIIGRITELHGTYYSEHWNFGLFFESRVATELSVFLNQFKESHDGLWVATVEDKVVGAIAIDGSKARTEGARLRWFIIDPAYQGSGMGNLLMEKAVNFCKKAGFSHVHLSTFAGLDAARHLYQKWGFTLREEQKGDQWGSVVSEQTFQLDL